jgi:hypothetical protein
MYGATEENLAAEKYVYLIPSSKKVIIICRSSKIVEVGTKKHYRYRSLVQIFFEIRQI